MNADGLYRFDGEVGEGDDGGLYKFPRDDGGMYLGDAGAGVALGEEVTVVSSAQETLLLRSSCPALPVSGEVALLGLSTLLYLGFLSRAIAYYKVGNSALEANLLSGKFSANSPVALRFPRATNFLGLSYFCSSSLVESLRLAEDALLPSLDTNTSTLTSLHDRIFLEMLLVDIVTSEKSRAVASTTPSSCSSSSSCCYSSFLTSLTPLTSLLLIVTFYSV